MADYLAWTGEQKRQGDFYPLVLCRDHALWGRISRSVLGIGLAAPALAAWRSMIYSQITQDIDAAILEDVDDPLRDFTFEVALP